MKIVLINPPENLHLRANFISTQYPINLGYLAAFLKKHGFQVELWDYVVEPYGQEEFLKKIKTSQPDLIGLTAMTNTVASMGELAKIIKNNFKDIRIIAGGTHASALPERTLREIPELDFVCVGEGEETLLELAQVLETERFAKLLDKIKGLVYRRGDDILKNKPRDLVFDLNSLPFPDRDLVNPGFYNRSHTSRGISRKFLRVAEIITARGCPNKCIFCAGHICYGYRVRFRTAENVMAEIKECIKKYRVNHITFLDDTFTLWPERTRAICSGLKELGVSWDCNTRVNNVDRDLLKLMSESGCRKVSFGIEASSERMLKLIKKGITLEQVRKAVRWAREAKIKYVEGTFILGAHPSETRQEAEATVKLMKELDLDFVFYGIIVPFPGTEVYKIMRDKGYLAKNVSWKDFIFFGETPPWRTDNFTPEELVRLQSRVLKKFYLRPEYLLKMIYKIDSWQEIRYYFDLFTDFFRQVILNLRQKKQSP